MMFLWALEDFFHLENFLHFVSFEESEMDKTFL